MTRQLVLGSALCLSLGFPAPSLAQQAPQPTTLILTLDPLSHVSFDDQLVLPITAGGAIRILSYPHEDGQAAALRVDPGDIGSRTLSLGAGKGHITAELLRVGKGFMRASKEGGLVIELDLVLRVTLSNSSGVREFPLHLTTESVESWDAEGTKRFTVAGTRADARSRVVQLVGKAAAGTNNELVPGAAVYLVLSGVIENLPALVPSAASGAAE